MSNLIFVDVEATGQSPIGGKMSEFGAVDYDTRDTFHGLIWKARPDPENPAKPILEHQVNDLGDVMEQFSEWIKAHTKGRAVFVSDNPAYDWQWISAAFDQCHMNNPFGHSARRISDFWAGLQCDWSDTQSWKRFRATPHTHNPVDDAIGNVEAFEKIMSIAKERRLKGDE
jgi:hypothetical protein